MKKFLIVLCLLVSSAALAGEDPFEGVWELEDMTVEDAHGNVRPWCAGAYGSIFYINGYMSTHVNCTSDPSVVVSYSGPYVFDGKIVYHHAKNFSDPKFNRVHERVVDMPDEDHLTLWGELPSGEVVNVYWKRR